MNLLLMSKLKVMLQKLHWDTLRQYPVRLQQTCIKTNKERFGPGQLSSHFAKDHNVENMHNNSIQPTDLNKKIE